MHLPLVDDGCLASVLIELANDAVRKVEIAQLSFRVHCLQLGPGRADTAWAQVTASVGEREGGRDGGRDRRTEEKQGRSEPDLTADRQQMTKL